MATKKRLGARIIEGLDEAIARSKGDVTKGRVTLVEVPEVDIQKVWRKMGLSQAGFASKFGFPGDVEELGAGAGSARCSDTGVAGGRC